MHSSKHPYADRYIRLNNTARDPHRGIVTPGKQFRVIDWWDRLGGGSWQQVEGNFAVGFYRARVEALGLPLDDEVVYGHIGEFGHLVHVSELTEDPAPDYS